MFNALIELNEEITNCISQRKYAHEVFIDLKKAVDTLANHILIDKLERYGIRWVVLDWMKSYINEDGSRLIKPLNLACGVPQGLNL